MSKIKTGSLYATPFIDREARATVHRQDGRRIAEIVLGGWTVGKEPSDFDYAQLFAAAPDLVEACEDMARAWGSGNLEEAAILKIRAAILKAGIK